MNKTEEVNKRTDDVSTDLTVVQEAGFDLTPLNQQSIELINQIIAEQDIQKSKDLTYLFNLNQNKKTIARINKLNDLLDIIADQAITRFSEHADEITTQELMNGLKTVQESVERGQKQVAGVQETPLIQINQQNNEVNLGDNAANLTKESRDRIKQAVFAMLGSLDNTNSNTNNESTPMETPFNTDELTVTELINEGVEKDI